jgi:chromosome partitioning protein
MLLQLKRFFARQICEPIHDTVRLSEAPILGRTIFEYDGGSAAARDYDLMVRRIMDDADPSQKDA